MGLSLGYQVGLKETYPEDSPQDVGSYLNGIPREMVLLVVSSLLNKVEIYETELRELLGFWFRTSNNSFANDAYKRLLKVEQKIGQPVSIITRPSVLKVFAYANNHLSDEKKLTDEEIEINLFKALLFQNDSINESETKITETTEKLDKDLRLYAMQFANSVRFSDIVNFDLYEVFVSEFVRAVLFFEFLEGRDEAKILLSAFYKHYKVADWKEFLKRISGISFSILRKENDGHLDLEIPKDESFESNVEFLNTLAAIKYDELADADFKTVRERPLQRIGEGKFRILSELFAVERIFKGLYFNLKAVNETLPKGEKVKDLRFLYTFHFSEKHALYELLRRTFPKKYVTYSGEELEKKGIAGAPDYYVRNGNKVFLFESKDSLVGAALKETGDFTKLDADLAKKFYIDGKDSKAVLQLLKFVESLLKGEFHKIDSGYKVDSLRIYPIVVIHDRQLDVPGFNKILNYWWSGEIKKLDGSISFEKVRPITVFDISTIILTHELLRDRRLLLEELIDQFHEFTKIKDPRHFRSENQFKKHAMDTALPFSFFIKQKVSSGKLPRAPERIIKEKAVIALER